MPRRTLPYKPCKARQERLPCAPLPCLGIAWYVLVAWIRDSAGANFGKAAILDPRVPTAIVRATGYTLQIVHCSELGP